MREYPEYRDHDIRAVENPYEAVFELAGMVGRSSRGMVRWLTVLMLFFLFYMSLTVAIIYLNLSLFNQSDFKYLGIAMALANLCVGSLCVAWLSRSMRSFRGLGQTHSLLQKIDQAAPEKAPGAREAGPAMATKPRNALNGLIETTISDSRRLVGNFRLVYLFIALWFINALISFIIQSVRFGPDLLHWKLDWLAPGGTGLDAMVFLVVSTIAYLKARNWFVFLSTRYAAIEYALNRPKAKIPSGATPLDRFKAYLAASEGYSDAAGWERSAYFDGVLRAAGGTVLVKVLDAAPDQEALAEFIRHMRAHGTDTRHAIVIYPEDPERPLSEAVYDFIISNPVRLGKELCTVELVMEGRDGLYDFVPVVSL